MWNIFAGHDIEFWKSKKHEDAEQTRHSSHLQVHISMQMEHKWTNKTPKVHALLMDLESLKQTAVLDLHKQKCSCMLESEGWAQ